MDNNQLVKEIITTTTERYGDNGNVKEKVTESREKIYSTAYSEEDIKKAKPIEKDEKVGENPAPTSPKPEVKPNTKEDDIAAAAAAIEKNKQNNAYDQATPNPLEGLPKPTGQENPYEAWQKQQQATNAITGMATPQPPQYNVANRMPTPTKFPWEQ